VHPSGSPAGVVGSAAGTSSSGAPPRTRWRRAARQLLVGGRRARGGPAAPQAASRAPPRGARGIKESSRARFRGAGSVSVGGGGRHLGLAGTNGSPRPRSGVRLAARDSVAHVDEAGAGDASVATSSTRR
jgi:hypothetical protein